MRFREWWNENYHRPDIDYGWHEEHIALEGWNAALEFAAQQLELTGVQGEMFAVFIRNFKEEI